MALSKVASRTTLSTAAVTACVKAVAQGTSLRILDRSLLCLLVLLRTQENAPSEFPPTAYQHLMTFEGLANHMASVAKEGYDVTALVMPLLRSLSQHAVTDAQLHPRLLDFLSVLLPVMPSLKPLLPSLILTISSLAAKEDISCNGGNDGNESSSDNEEEGAKERSLPTSAMPLLVMLHERYPDSFEEAVRKGGEESEGEAAMQLLTVSEQLRARYAIREVGGTSLVLALVHPDPKVSRCCAVLYYKNTALRNVMWFLHQVRLAALDRVGSMTKDQPETAHLPWDLVLARLTDEDQQVRSEDVWLGSNRSRYGQETLPCSLLVTGGTPSAARGCGRSVVMGCPPVLPPLLLASCPQDVGRAQPQQQP